MASLSSDPFLPTPTQALLGMVLATYETDLPTAERIAAEVAPKFAGDLDAEELEVRSRGVKIRAVLRGRRLASM